MKRQINIMNREYILSVTTAPPALSEITVADREYYQELGVDQGDARELFECIQTRLNEAPGFKDFKGSMYRQAWAALKLSGFEPENILEFGTYLGHSAAYLAMLFPGATIYTVDMAPDDPLYPAIHPQGAEYEARLKENIDRSNIISIRTNTMHLNVEDIPDCDLIFVDAGHNFPTVAFDHFLALQKLKAGGWIFSDDVGQGNDIHKTITYINERNADKFRFLTFSKSKPRPGHEKYIAFMRRSK